MEKHEIFKYLKAAKAKGLNAKFEGCRLIEGYLPEYDGVMECADGIWVCKNEKWEKHGNVGDGPTNGD